MAFSLSTPLTPLGVHARKLTPSINCKQYLSSVKRVLLDAEQANDARVGFSLGVLSASQELLPLAIDGVLAEAQ